MCGAPLIEGLRTMQVPSILLGESRTRLLQGIAIGAVASIAIGFSWGGWVTGSTAHRLAADQASTAVVAALTPVCVEKFLQNSDATANLAVLQKISTYWEQGDYVVKGGWATGYDLARACAAKLIEAKAASQ
jgi:alpha/beta superfamily hydrolase